MSKQLEEALATLPSCFIIKRGRPLPEAEIEDLERRLKVKFPESFRGFLKELGSVKVLRKYDDVDEGASQDEDIDEADCETVLAFGSKLSCEDEDFDLVAAQEALRVECSRWLSGGWFIEGEDPGKGRDPASLNVVPFYLFPNGFSDALVFDEHGGIKHLRRACLHPEKGSFESVILDELNVLREDAS